MRGGLSKVDYEISAPAGSFIDTRDFTAPKDLAVHMKKVATDLDLFRSYHVWRKVSLNRIYPSLCPFWINLDAVSLCHRITS